MQELSQLLADATQAIEPAYFRLNIDGGDPVYRERVYCYELYHQMRMLWPPNCPYYLNGEIDKAAHPVLTQLGAGFAKPDFLVHTPGYMSGNQAVIEVKCARAGIAGIQKDVKTLSTFINKVGYERAIYLIYGDECDDRLINRVKLAAGHTGTRAPIELWVHGNPGQPAGLLLVLGQEPDQHIRKYAPKPRG
jgi:hypothetical protein